MNITAKIWLSVGIFVLGYICSTTLGQVQGMKTEKEVRSAAEALFPAAQRSQEAESAFQLASKSFSDAVVLQDTAGLDRASEEGKQVVASLKALAAIDDLPQEAAEGAKVLLTSTERLLTDARQTYGAVLADPANMNADRMRELATRTEACKTALRQNREKISGQLQDRLASIQEQSAWQRRLGIGLFVVTLLVAGILVNVTIRRGITGPVKRVINGVQQAADQAGTASSALAESGQTVASDAEYQASYVEETSASLEGISASTKENAVLAHKADALMRQARETVEQSMQTMKDLSASMTVVSGSSREVSAVLKSIDEIAFHTNLLALNAAVEAARAGEAGAGFSIVADEVRSLAHRAAEAARRSAEIIEKTIADIGTGAQLVSRAQVEFNRVSSDILNSGEVVSQIAVRSEEQAQGVGQIRDAITRIEDITHRNADNSRRTAETAVMMSDQVQSTREHLDQLLAIVGLRDKS